MTQSDCSHDIPGPDTGCGLTIKWPFLDELRSHTEHLEMEIQNERALLQI
jgi:hypothetical protein